MFCIERISEMAYCEPRLETYVVLLPHIIYNYEGRAKGDFNSNNLQTSFEMLIVYLRVPHTTEYNTKEERMSRSRI